MSRETSHLQQDTCKSTKILGILLSVLLRTDNKINALKRALIWKYRESANRSEITNFALFGQKNPFVELFSEMTLKGSVSFYFFQNLGKLKGLPRRPWRFKIGECLTCSYRLSKRCLNISFARFNRHFLKFIVHRMLSGKSEMFLFEEHLTFGSGTIYWPQAIEPISKLWTREIQSGILHSSK